MLHDLFFRLRTLFRRPTAESELDDELRFHLERQIAKYVKSGISEGEATRRARLEFGGIDQVKDECRDARGISFVETLAQDALRRSNPASFTCVHRLCRPDAGARHWRQHRDLQRRQ